MSSCLTFRKNGTVLCSFSRNTELYQACRYLAPYDKWEIVSKDDFEVARDNLKESLREHQKNKDTYQETLKYNLAYEDLFSTIQHLQELDEEITEIENALVKLNLFEDIANEIYCEETDDENIFEEQDCVFEWMIS